MFKKILMISASALLATTAVTAEAIQPTSPPPTVTYDIASLTGSIKLVGSTAGTGGSTKFLKLNGDAKSIIRLALGGDPDVAVANEKNYVLGLASISPGQENVDDCGAEILVWDKVAHVVKAEVAFLSPSDCSDGSGDDLVVSEPAPNKGGTYQEYFTLKIKFIGAETSCGSLDTSALSGDARALGLFTAKVTVSGQVRTETPTSLALTHMLGDVEAPGDTAPVHLVITDGAYKGNLTPTKLLGTNVTTPIKLTCPN